MSFFCVWDKIGYKGLKTAKTNIVLQNQQNGLIFICFEICFILIRQNSSYATADFCQNSLHTIFPFFARFARNLIKWDFLRWFSNIVILLRLAFASLLCMCNFGNKFGRRRRETMRTKCWLYNNTSTAKLLLLWTKESKKKKELEKELRKRPFHPFTAWWSHITVADSLVFCCSPLPKYFVFRF